MEIMLGLEIIRIVEFCHKMEKSGIFCNRKEENMHEQGELRVIKSIDTQTIDKQFPEVSRFLITQILTQTFSSSRKALG